MKASDNKGQWNNDGEYFEYTHAANPKMPAIIAQIMDVNLQGKRTEIIPINLSSQLQIAYPATTPNCLVSFIMINKNEHIECFANATSNLFVVIKGSGSVSSSAGKVQWKSGDVFTAPYSTVTLYATDDALLYWVNDSPLLNYLQVKPDSQSFAPTFYPAEDIKKFAVSFNQQKNASKRNRNGVLLGNKDCPLTKTITPTLWALFNIIHPKTIQAPHKHNSVALDLSLSAKDGVYTLMSPELDNKGNLVNPIRFDWGNGKAFITPPGWWHIHVNESDEDAVVIPIQDAGLQTYMRTLFIKFQPQSFDLTL